MENSPPPPLKVQTPEGQVTDQQDPGKFIFSRFVAQHPHLSYEEAEATSRVLEGPPVHHSSPSLSTPLETADDTFEFFRFLSMCTNLNRWDTTDENKDPSTSSPTPVTVILKFSSFSDATGAEEMRASESVEGSPPPAATMDSPGPPVASSLFPEALTLDIEKSSADSLSKEIFPIAQPYVGSPGSSTSGTMLSTSPLTEFIPSYSSPIKRARRSATYSITTLMESSPSKSLTRGETISSPDCRSSLLGSITSTSRTSQTSPLRRSSSIQRSPSVLEQLSSRSTGLRESLKSAHERSSLKSQGPSSQLGTAFLTFLTSLGKHSVEEEPPPKERSRRKRPTSPLPEISQQWPTSPIKSSAVDPYSLGLAAWWEALRDEAHLTEELRRDLESLDWLPPRGPCPCDVPRHPSHWSHSTISQVHKYSFLLDTQGLKMSRERVVTANLKETLVVYNIPMVDGHPWKKKAEQVICFTDVEAGFGDQTAFDLLCYIQPCDRKMLLVVASHRVLGLVVAEPCQWAHRIESETVRFRELSAEAVPVRLGINRLWVHVSVRRHHLATLLCKIAGQLFNEGQILEKEHYAFNNISDAGVAFAKLFLKTWQVPLYEGKTGRKL